jgi:homoserine O-acetyltransferase
MTTSHTQSITLFTHADPLLLDCGKELAPVTVAFETYGALNTDGTNAVLVCHALTGSAHAASGGDVQPEPGWWDPLIGPGRVFDTRRYFVVCSNVLGSRYGTTGPTSADPATGKPYGAGFPSITIRDMVRVQRGLLDALGVKRLVTVIGSSLGGMQVLEWALLYPEFCDTIIPISVSARQTAWCIALNSAARAAIHNDPVKGLSVARMIGMISYRSAAEMEERFGRHKQHPARSRFDPENPFEVESYLAYQGVKLVQRFDAQTYLCLSRAMDLHDITWQRGDLCDVLRSVKARTLCLGVSTDMRYPPTLQQELARHIPRAQYAKIDSIHGHDAFLIEFDALTAIIGEFLAMDYCKGNVDEAEQWRARRPAPPDFRGSAAPEVRSEA